MQFTLFDTAHNYRRAKGLLEIIYPSPHPHPKANAGFPREMASFFLVWWLSNLGTSESHEILLKHRSLGTTLRVSNSVDRELAFLTRSTDAPATHQRTTLWKPYSSQSEATVERKHLSQLTLYLFYYFNWLNNVALSVIYFQWSRLECVSQPRERLQH